LVTSEEKCPSLRIVKILKINLGTKSAKFLKRLGACFVTLAICDSKGEKISFSRK